MSDELATFDDRLTMRHTRVFPLPIELVWEAVSEGQHLETWLLPVSRVEPRLGGAFVFSWGSPEGTAGQSTGTIDEFDPPRSIRYRANDGYLQFTLEPVDGGTRLHFIQNFTPGADLGPREYPGGDQPAGADSPWRPGFCAGFHNFLDALGEFLAGELTYEQQRSYIEAVHNGELVAELPSHVSREREEELTVLYRAHIAATCPQS